MQRFFAFLLAAFALLMAACAGQPQSIAAITALPSQNPNTAATITPTPTPSSQPTALSGFAAMVATNEASTRQATPTPFNANLEAGAARAIAAATDAALLITPRSPVEFERFPVKLKFEQFYDGYSIREGLILSDMLTSLDGQPVTMEGYMAPPLKPKLDYFVLTRVQLQYCPFCSTAADWPDDIALVYMTNNETTATAYPVRVTGRMEVGMSIDQETGMVSLVRIYAETMEILN